MISPNQITNFYNKIHTFPKLLPNKSFYFREISIYNTSIEISSQTKSALILQSLDFWNPHQIWESSRKSNHSWLFAYKSVEFSHAKRKQRFQIKIFDILDDDLMKLLNFRRKLGDDSKIWRVLQRSDDRKTFFHWNFIKISDDIHSDNILVSGSILKLVCQPLVQRYH